MADPLEDRFASFFAGLRLAWPAADEPVEPNPVFSTRLRARVERALTLPRGVAVSTTTLLPSVASEIETDRSAVIPYLAVRAADRALAWYAEVLGARLRGEPIMMGDGRIGHAELEIAGGVLYLADEHPEIGVAAPQPGAATVSLVLPVADVDEVAARAAEAGGQLTRPPYDGHGLRNATVVDPFGHRWMLQAPLPVEPEAAAVGAGTGQAAYRPGDVRYVSLSVPDAERAAVFYGEVLGWSVSAGPEPQSRRVANTTPAVGIWGGQERSTLFCCFAVDDIAAAVERVRAAGGTAAAATPGHGGLIADCEDDAGTAFALYQPAGDLPGSERPAANGTRPGDLAYLTLEVSDPARARAFYGAVLGWTFRPGRADQGAEVEDVVPMTGMHGGHPVAAGVPMWRVDDIDAAVRRVRRAGGTATEPVRQPYGLMAECTDDQGTRFYLGQL